jgi:hypothetical protein
VGKQINVDLSPFLLINLDQIYETRSAEVTDDPVEPRRKPTLQRQRERAEQIVERGLKILFRDGYDQVQIALRIFHSSRQ